jgi:hypothetical protein
MLRRMPSISEAANRRQKPARALVRVTVSPVE